MRFYDPVDDPEKAARRPLYFFLIATLGVGALASLFTSPQIPTWYASLNKPSFTPPNWLFAPVWTTLYVLMGFAAWRAWKKCGFKSAAMTLFAIQLALNFLWSVLFFGLHQMSSALIDIALLDLGVLATLLAFWRHDRLAALLFLPYLAWTLFATLLNHAFLQLNS